MKVSIARIRLVLKTGKTLADGTHPIMLYAAFNGKKMVSTGYSCTERYWDKKGECVKRGYPNFVMINAAILKLKNDCIARRDEYERLGKVYTVDMLLEKREVLCGSSNLVSNLVSEYCEEKGLSSSSVALWGSVSSLLSEYGGSALSVNQMTEQFVRKFSVWMRDKKKLKDSTISIYLGKVGALETWCIGKGLIASDEHCFKAWKFKRIRVDDNTLEYVHPSLIPIVKEYFQSLIYTDGKFDQSKAAGLMDVRSSLFTMYMWCLGLTLSGLAPIDLCLLKKTDFRLVKGSNGVDYWALDVARKKTGKFARMRIRVDNPWNQLMIQYMLNINARGDWFLPVLNGLDGKDMEACKVRTHSALERWNKGKLRRHWKEINIIIQSKIWAGENLPYIDEGLSMYSYRHTFAMHYMCNGGNAFALAGLLGHSNSMRSLAHYIALLQRDNDIIDNIIEI